MNPTKIFLCGDAMTGREIDRILPHPSSPQLLERNMNSTGGYVRLVETMNGPIPRPANFSYIWGVALDEWRRAAPDLRLINLKTATTGRESFFPKGINYRMSPENVECLLAADIGCCALANNHVLDWGVEGLIDTLQVLERRRSATLNDVGENRD